jgi:hypothetical protein
MRVAARSTCADHWGMDIDKAALVTVERALARVPLTRRRRVPKLLKRKGCPEFGRPSQLAPQGRCEQQ